MKNNKIVSDRQLHEVDEAVAREIQHLTNQVRYQALKRNECRASRSTYWRCEGDCPKCTFWAPKAVSLDDTDCPYHAQACDPRGEDQMCMIEWYQVIAGIIPDGEIVAKLWVGGATNLDIAKYLGVSASTVHDRKMKLRRELPRMMVEW